MIIVGSVHHQCFSHFTNFFSSPSASSNLSHEEPQIGPTLSRSSKYRGGRMSGSFLHLSPGGSGGCGREPRTHGLHTHTDSALS